MRVSRARGVCAFVGAPSVRAGRAPETTGLQVCMGGGFRSVRPMSALERHAGASRHGASAVALEGEAGMDGMEQGRFFFL